MSFINKTSNKKSVIISKYWHASLFVFILLNGFKAAFCLANEIQPSTKKKCLATEIADNYIKSFPSEEEKKERGPEKHALYDIRPPQLTEKTKPSLRL